MMFSNRSRIFCPDRFFCINDVLGTELKFSECFQLSVLSIPSLVFMIAVCIWFPILKSKKQLFITNIKFGWVQKFRLVVVTNLLMCSLITLISTAVADSLDSYLQFDFVYYVSPSLNIISLIVYALLMENQRRAHQPRSQLLFMYILSLFICALPRFYGITTSPHSEDISIDSGTVLGKIHLYTFSVYICLIFAELLTHFFSPHNRENSLLQDKNACSELWVSVPCLWTFNWITSTIFKAYRGKISTTDDLFHITRENSVKFNYERFKKSWIKSTHLWLRKNYNSCQSEVIVDDNFQDDKSPLVTTSSIITSPAHSDNNKSIILHNQNNSINIPEVRIISSSVSFNSNGSRNQKLNSTTNLSQSNDNENGKQTNSIFYTWILIHSLLTSFGLRLLIGWTLLFIGVILNFSAPFLLGKLLQFLSNPNAPLWHGYAIASTLLCLQLLSTLTSQRGFYKCLSLGVAVRSTLTSAVYRKSLLLSSEARSTYTTGELINLLSVDVNRVMELFMFSFLIWDAVIEFILAFILLWYQLGLATLAGIGTLVLMLPLNVLLMWITQKFELAEMKWKDARMKVLGEVFGSIRIIKLYAWEKAFESNVTNIRQHELKKMFTVAFGWGFAQIIWYLAPYLILLSTFYAYSYEILSTTYVNSTISQTNFTIPALLTPERIFVSVNLFNLLRSPLVLLPWSLSSSVMALVSIRRIGKFLLADELEPYITNDDSFSHCLPTLHDSSFVLSMNGASFSWTKNGPLILKNLTVEIPHGCLVAIVGCVGSGKSSFISACLGDMVKRSGSIRIQGSIAYVPQTAWIQQRTLKNNIVFSNILNNSDTDGNVDFNDDNNNKHMDEIWYRTVITACALEPDIAHLPAGDNTEIGEKGVNLSGGQRQRVSLARAVYQRRDIYLMDDPLSAVDSHVGKHLFDHVLGPNGLLKDKTRIITTNSFHILKSTDWIILLDKNGTIAQTGTYKEMIDLPSGQFADYMNSIQTKPISTHKSDCSPNLNKDLIGSEMKAASSSLYKSIDHNLETSADISNLDISHSSVKDNITFTEALSRSPPHNLLKKLSFDVPDSCTSLKRMQVDSEPHISYTPIYLKQNENFSEQEIEIVVETPTESTAIKSNHDNKQHINFLQNVKLNNTLTANITDTSITGCSISSSDNSSRKNSMDTDDSSTNLHCLDRNIVSKSDDHEIGRFITEEEISHGHVPWLAYWAYFIARGLLLIFIASLVYSSLLAIQAFSNYWLQWFADDKQLILAEKALKNQSIILNDTTRYYYLNQIKIRTYYYIIGYALIGVGQIMSVFIYTLINTYSSVRASKIIHHQLLTHVLHASIIFFDHTPLGRILNRFSMDIDNLDHNIPSALFDVIACFGDVFTALIIVMLSLYPIGIGILIVLPLLLLCTILLILYLPCARQSRRLDALTRSPLLCNFNETAVSALGVTIVRTFKLTDKFIQLSDQLIDINAVNEFLRYVSNRWLDIYLNLFCDLMVFSCGLLVITYRSTISTGLAGLIIIYALQIAESFTWVVKQLSQLETAAVSLERIREYTTQIDQEGDWDHGPDSKLITPDWPRPCCQIIFNKTTVQYCLSRKSNTKCLTNYTDDNNTEDDINHEDDSNSKKNTVRALKSINLKLSGNYNERRIGIVGRTGAGKSSLASALFRLIEPIILSEDQLSSSTTLKESTNYSGPIIVDGIDLTRIGLHELRSRFSILPQEPIIFAGTLRFNLDPFNHRTDEELWAAIRAAHLMDWIQSNNVSLDYECGEGGSNLSAGQRQLVCLARIFLSSGGRVRLLILDEATSAMDPVTDNLVMNTVMGEQFNDATIIIIAHRLSTIMNTDKIVVLDHGQIVEIGHPKELLKKPNSYFAKMNKIRHL